MSPPTPRDGSARRLRRRRVALALAVGLLASLALAGGAALWLDHEPPPPATVSSLAAVATAAADNPGQVARGAYLARVGNCAGCHTARGGAAYAGGRGLATPFGTVFAGNLTPDADTGLGRWSADDFWRALHHGRSRDGRWLAPAFPYTEFSHVNRADSDALHAYLRSLAPVRQAAPASGLRFPFNTQLALAMWRALYFQPAAPDALDQPGRSAQWQRGAYLVRGLGHCAACHAPRNVLGATVQAAQLAGGALPMQPWFAPSLAPRSGQPLPVQAQDLVALLRTGQSAHGTASGPMAEVVVASTQHWTDGDLQAAATYLTSLPPQPAAPRLAEAATPELAAQRLRGAALYADRCASCHGDDGQGAPGIYPPLAANPSVTLADPGNALQVIRHGGFAPATAANPRPYGMPPAAVSPQELADVLTHVRQSWGNQAAAVSVQQVMGAR